MIDRKVEIQCPYCKKIQLDITGIESFCECGAHVVRVFFDKPYRHYGYIWDTEKKKPMGTKGD